MKRNTKSNTKKTALVLKRIVRDEWGSPDKGYMAEPFDRVVVISSRTFSCGNRTHQCVTDSGERFVASDSMIQLDSEV
jgi:hypothetical protein